MIAFTSRTGNVRHLVAELNLPSCEINHDLVMNQPYFLFTFTDGLGDVPEIVEDFLNVELNHLNLRGVIASGNTNFGMRFCESANKISRKFNVPVIRKIDLRGNKMDIEAIKEHYNNLIKGD